MTATTTVVAMPASRLPRPPELLPGKPDAVVDLQTDAGVDLVRGKWRYADARIEEIEFVEVAGADGPDPLGPGDVPNRTQDVLPHAQAADFDDSGWRVLAPAETRLRLGGGRVAFGWYRLSLTLPERLGETDATGATIVFEVVVDDYGEVWVDGELPLALGYGGGQAVAGFNAPNRVVLTRDACPGQTFQIAVFAINGPISASPRNYLWLRTATLEVYAAGRTPTGFERPLSVQRSDRRLDDILPAGVRLEQVAGGFEFTEGPVWSPDGALLFSSPNTNVIYRWDAKSGAVAVFDSKAGYAGLDIGRYAQPGSNGLTFDPQGRLVICQHGNRRVLRVNPHGDTTVLAARYEGRRLNSPNDLVFRSDGTLYFTDPPFGLPQMADDPERELPSAVYSVRHGAVRLETDELEGPNGIALSPDERQLYVGNWAPARKVVMRYDVNADGTLLHGHVFSDMTGAPGDDAIDGIKVDEAGNVYVCGPGGIWVLSPTGERLGLIGLPEPAHNLAWGDEDGRTLYITALTGVYRMRLAIAGVRPRRGKHEQRT